MTQAGHVSIDADVLGALHADIARLTREVEVLGSKNIEKLGVDLIESVNSGVRLVKFAMSWMNPSEVHGWPTDDLRRFATLVRDLPQSTISDRINHQAWANDALSFATEAEACDRKRQRYETVRSLEDIPRGLSVLYVAHPVGAATVEGIQANVARAKRWLRWLCDHDTRHAFSMPWLPYVEALDDSNPDDRKRGLRDQREMTKRHDGIVLVGGRLSSGMSGELTEMRDRGRPCVDLLHLGEEPPSA